MYRLKMLIIFAIRSFKNCCKAMKAFTKHLSIQEKAQVIILFNKIIDLLIYFIGKE